MPTRALVVDDSRVMRLLLAKALKEVGITDILEAGDGRTGLSVLQNAPDVAVALIDWNMPTMSGIEMVEAAKGDGRFTRLILVMVTTEADQAHMERASAAGVNAFIVKPFTTEVVVDTLRRLGI